MIARRFMETARPSGSCARRCRSSVEQALQRALARTAADRFGTTAQFAAALQAGAASSGDRRGRSGPPQRPAAAPRRARRRPPPPRAAPAPRSRVAAAPCARAPDRARRAVRLAARPPDAAGGAGGRAPVAVLPFENLGDSADEYFADGDHRRGARQAHRAAGLQVIARSSSNQYRGTTKTPQEIGRELGVDYLLIGKVRWEKNAGGASRVQVSPELIDVATADARRGSSRSTRRSPTCSRCRPTSPGRWRRRSTWRSARGSSRRWRSGRPQNLAAYDAYLKGEAAGGAAAADPQPCGRPSATSSRRWRSTRPSRRRGRSCRAAQLAAVHQRHADAGGGRPVARRGRAGAGARPAEPGGPLALGDYYRCHRRLERAARATTPRARARAQRCRPAARPGLAEQALGRWDAAVEHFGAARAWIPASAGTRQHARRCPALAAPVRRGDSGDRRGDRAPAGHRICVRETRPWSTWPGATWPARARCWPAPGRTSDLPSSWPTWRPTGICTGCSDPEQRALLTRLTPAAFDGDAGTWGLALAGVYEMEGDRRRAPPTPTRPARRSSSSSRRRRRTLSGTFCSAWPWPTWAEGCRRSRKPSAASRSPASEDAMTVPYYQHQLVRDLHPGRGAGEGDRPARDAAQDPVLPLARLAQDRSHLRSAAVESTVPAAGGGNHCWASCGGGRDAGRQLVRAQPRGVIVDLRGEHQLVRAGPSDDRLQPAPHRVRRSGHRVRQHLVDQVRARPASAARGYALVGRRQLAGMPAPQVHEGLLQRGEQPPCLLVRVGREDVDAEHRRTGCSSCADGRNRAR